MKVDSIDVMTRSIKSNVIGIQSHISQSASNPSLITRPSAWMQREYRCPSRGLFEGLASKENRFLLVAHCVFRIPTAQGK